MLMMLHFPQNSEKNIKIKEVISFMCFQSDRFPENSHFYSYWTFLQLLGCIMQQTLKVVNYCKTSLIFLGQIIQKKQSITLSVITLSGFHTIIKQNFHFNNFSVIMLKFCDDMNTNKIANGINQIKLCLQILKLDLW